MCARVFADPRRWLLLSAAMSIGAALIPSRSTVAEQRVYEPFVIGSGPGEYDVGPIHGQPDPPIGPLAYFLGSWIGPAAVEHVVQETSLTYLGSPSQGGSVASRGEGRVGRYLATPWDDTTEGTFYLSYLADYGTVENPASTNNADLGFRATEFWPAGSTIGVDAGRSEIGFDAFDGSPDQRLPSSSRLQWVTPGAPPTPITDTVFNDFAGTHLIVMKFVLSTAAASDTITVFLDPWSAAEPEFPNAIATGLDYTLGAISTISTFGTTAGARPVFDELRIGTEYGDAIPPPPPPDGPCSLPDYACYLEILNHMNLTGQAAGYADVNHDGRVDLRDFRLWKDNRIDIAPGSGSLSAAGVPEPSNLMLALVAMIAAAGAAGRFR